MTAVERFQQYWLLICTIRYLSDKPLATLEIWVGQDAAVHANATGMSSAFLQTISFVFLKLNGPSETSSLMLGGRMRDLENSAREQLALLQDSTNKLEAMLADDGFPPQILTDLLS